MFNPFNTLTKNAIVICLTLVAPFARAQDGTIYPLEAPAEPNAIPLATGGVENQPAPETWFRQWGGPMARNISAATLTPFLPKAGTANGAAIMVARGRLPMVVDGERRLGSCPSARRPGHRCLRAQVQAPAYP